MTGEYTIDVWNKRVRYSLKIKRNITIITGDSGTGKTTLAKLVDAYDDMGVSSGVHLTCKLRCAYLHGREWMYDLSRIDNAIVFIDEQSKFITKKEFAEAIKNTNNYYVIITRCNLNALPYSIHEIYGLRTVNNNQYSNSKQIYNEQYRLFGKNITDSGIKPEIVITEDSNSGYDFFSKVCEKYGKKCVPTNGKSNIKTMIGNKYQEKVVIIADGAAFGCEIRDILLKIEEYPNYSVYLPESFEWLLLKAETVRDAELEKILNQPYDYVDCCRYFSWERFFTDLITRICAKTPGKLQYTKSKLNDFFMQENNMNKVLEIIKEIQFH